jgi:PAS domain S-box-containing protein
MDSAIDGIAILNEKGEYTYLNIAHAKIYGYSSINELIGKTWKILYDTDELRRFEKKIMLELSQKRHWMGETVGKKKDGKTFPQELSLTLLDNEGIICVVKDITERKKAEEEILNSKKLLQRIIDLLPIRVFWKDKDLKFLGCNEIFVKDAGKKSPDELIGKDDFQMNWKEQAKAYREDDLRTIKFGKSKLNYEEAQTRPKGDKIWLKISKMPLTDVQGNIIGVLGTYEDITERKKTENALHVEQEKARLYLNTIETIIVALDKVGNITSINKKGCQVFGRKEDELIGKSWFSTCLPQSKVKKEVLSIFKKIITGEIESAEYYENAIITKSGELRQIAWHNSLLHNEEGKIIGTLSSGDDITEKKRAEEELKTSEIFLQDKIADLEIFNKIAIDRELKMIELKERIKALEEKLKKQQT